MSTLHQVKAHVDDFIGAMNTGRYDINIITKFLLFSKEAKGQCLSILYQLKKNEQFANNCYDVADVVGRALAKLLKNDDVVLSLVGNGLDYNKPINIPQYKKYEMMTPKELEKINVYDFFNGNSTSNIFSSRNERDPNDISYLIEEVNPIFFENMCRSLSGCFLPRSLRQFIWTYRLLQKNKLSLINAPLLSKELFRSNFH